MGNVRLRTLLHVSQITNISLAIETGIQNASPATSNLLFPNANSTSLPVLPRSYLTPTPTPKPTIAEHPKVSPIPPLVNDQSTQGNDLSEDSVLLTPMRPFGELGWCQISNLDLTISGNRPTGMSPRVSRVSPPTHSSDHAKQASPGKCQVPSAFSWFAWIIMSFCDST